MLGLANLGEFSTAYYRSRIDSLAPGLHYQRVGCDFARINQCLPDNDEGLEPLLAELIAAAQDAGVTQLLLPNITLHHAFYQNPHWQQDVTLFDPFDLLGRVLQAQQVFVLGTRHTQASTSLAQRLREYSLEVQPMREEDINRVDTLRLDIFHNGCSTRCSIELEALVNKLATHKPVVIACTEISLALHNRIEHVVDLAELQIGAFVGN